MRAVIPILIVVAALMTAFIAIDPLASRSKGDQIANRRVLDEFAHPPGVELIHLHDSPYYSERGPVFSDIPIGWTLRVTLRPVAGITASDVLAFYEKNAPDGWRTSVQETPHLDLATGRVTGSSRSLMFRRGSATVSINVDNLDINEPGTYEIGIDHSPRR